MEEELIKGWITVKYNKITIKKVSHDCYRVNLYEEKGETVRFFNIIRSYYLQVKDGEVKDKTLCKK